MNNRRPEIKSDLCKKSEINFGVKEEVDYWTARLDVTKVQLKAAINAVGNDAGNVMAWLKRK